MSCSGTVGWNEYWLCACVRVCLSACVCVYVCVHARVCACERVCSDCVLVLCFVKIFWEKEHIKQYINISIIYKIILTLMHSFIHSMYLCFPEYL